MGKSLRVTVTLPFCQIGTDAHNNGLQINNRSGGVSNASVASVNPVFLAGATKTASTPTGFGGNWLSPQLSLMAYAFDRYRMTALEWVYEPQATTSVDDRLVLAYTDDPDHPIVGANWDSSSTPTTTPTQTDLLITPDSVAFAPWMPWVLRCPVERIDDKYVATSGAAGSIGGAQGRLAFHGNVACVAFSATPATYGILYCRATYDFSDPVPTVHGSVSEARSALIDSIEEKKKPASPAGEDSDPEIIAPPRFLPAPSAPSVPGTPAYTPKVSSRK